MPTYTKPEARDWARERLRGVANVIIPTFTADLRDVNESAIRHDVRRDIELGFLGALAVAETATTPDEYVRFVEWAVDEAAGRLMTIHHASFNTLDENVEMARRASAAGAELVLLSYPPTFYPRHEQDIYDYTRSLCDAIDLAVILFPVPLWGFERLHPASLSIELVTRLVDDVPNIVSVKAEGGHPSLGGFAEVWRRLHDRVVVTMPLEYQAIPLATLLPLEFIGTSNSECLGGRVPEMLALTRAGKHDEAMELFWRCEPVRRANERIGAIGGSNTVHRMGWKYQGWLTGFNGGPLRQPTARLVLAQMRMLRGAAQEAGVLVSEEDDARFFEGRNPR